MQMLNVYGRLTTKKVDVYKMIKRELNKIPLSISGLALGTAGAGNLIASYGEIYKYTLGSLSAFILLCLLLKLGTNYKEFFRDLNKPLVLDTVVFIPMSIMILLTYVHIYSKTTTFVIWILAILIIFALIFYHAKLYLFSNFSISNMFPSTMVVYVGIGLSSVTAPVFGAERLGQFIFWFAFVSFVVITPVIAYRVFVRSIDDAIKPTMAILIAPGCMTLTGYLSSFKNPKVFFVSALLILSFMIYIIVLLYLLKFVHLHPVKVLKEDLYTRYSALTFPLVISAISLNKCMHYYSSLNMTLNIPLEALKNITVGSTAIAILVVIYVVILYVLGMYKMYAK